MVGVERTQYIHANETIYGNTPSYINTLETSVPVWTKPLCRESGTKTGTNLHPFQNTSKFNSDNLPLC